MRATAHFIQQTKQPFVAFKDNSDLNPDFLFEHDDEGENENN